MPALNATFTIPTTAPFSNKTYTGETQFSSQWYNDQYITYIVRVVALGGTLFLIRLIFIWGKYRLLRYVRQSSRGTFCLAVNCARMGR